MSCLFDCLNKAILQKSTSVLNFDDEWEKKVVADHEELGGIHVWECVVSFAAGEALARDRRRQEERDGGEGGARHVQSALVRMAPREPRCGR